MIRFYDSSLGKVETPQGTMTLSKVFFPFFLEMFLMNLMSTVNTFTLSFFSAGGCGVGGGGGPGIGVGRGREGGGGPLRVYRDSSVG